MAELECENLALHPKGLTPAIGHLHWKGGKKFHWFIHAQREIRRAPYASFTSRVCAVNSANQVHCFNVREKRITIVCLLCYPVLWFMSYSDEAEAEYRHLIYFIVTHSDE